MKSVVPLVVLVCFVSWVTCDVSTETNDADIQARIFLRNFDKRLSKAITTCAHTLWAYYQNSTDIAKKKYVQDDADYRRLCKILNAQAEQFNLSKVSNYIKRSLQAAIGATAFALDASNINEVTTIVTEMIRIQNSPEFCLSPDRCFSKDSVPSITESMQSSQNPKEIADIWVGYHSSIGRKIKPLYPRYVELMNESARLKGFKDNGEVWRSSYELSNIEQDVLPLLEHIKKLYIALHTYVKHHLKKLYGADLFPSSGHIPAHLLNGLHNPLWKPYPNKSVDISQALKDHRYTVKKIYDAADDFYKSLGFPGMPPSVWNNSSLGFPVKGQNKVCHGGAWDFHDRHDFRLSMCAKVSHGFLKTIYHEMGHLVYFQQYAYQPVYFHSSAHAAFHESMGDIMGMSAESLEYLKKIGLIKRNHNYDEIGSLLQSALGNVFRMPYTLILDLFRWDVFSGKITPENYNKEWWRLQCKYLGRSPPANRSQDDFDPGTIHHVAAGGSTLRYFISAFLQYSLYDQSCRDKGHRGDLHLCDFSGSKLVGAKFMNFMREGSSRPWKDLLRDFTGSEDINPESITNYYKPLYNFLINNSGNETSGWKDECDPYPTVE